MGNSDSVKNLASDTQEKTYMPPFKVLVIITVFIFIAETLVMFLFTLLPPLDPKVEMFVDSILLVILLVPTLYIFLFRQFVSHIEEHKLAKENLRAQQQKTDSIIRTIGEGIIVIGTDSRIQFANQELFDIFGYTFDELEGQHVHMLMPEKYRTDYTRGMNEHLKSGPAKVLKSRLEAEGQRKDGSVFPLEMKIAEANSGEDNIFFTAAIRDITERRKTVTELSRLAAAINQSEDSVVITDREGVIVYVNPAFERLTGYSSAEVVGQNASILKGGQHDKAYYEDLWKTILKGKTWRGRFTNKKKNGEIFIEDATITPVIGESGKVSNFVAVKRDITKRLKLEREIRQSQKMDAMGRLAGGIAHDFNNILTGIIGYTEISLEDLPKESEPYKSLVEALKASNRAKDLIKQILTFSRETEHEFKPLQPHLIINESLNLLRASFPTTIEIKTDIDKSAGIILGDPTQLTQVIMNLCTNAEYAMHKSGGVLEVSLKAVSMDDEYAGLHGNLKAGNFVKLTVRDTGTGMDKKTIEHMIEPFFTTKPKGEGTGMGLSVVHGIVAAHDGAIDVYSEVGKGTTFKIYLPKTETGKTKKEEKTAPIKGGSERILMVDDEESITMIGKKMLERLGYKVITKTDPKEALQAFTASPDDFDLIITDHTMPGMTGTELAKKIISIRKEIPIILCTGYGLSFSDKDMKDYGIKEMIIKPFMKRTLAETIRKVLD